MTIEQKIITLDEYPRGCQLISAELFSRLPGLGELEVGMLQLTILHTSASLVLNENADPEVRTDMEAILNHLVPEGLPFLTHLYEGADDMPAHAKAAILGSSVMIPINRGRPVLGTWQGIYLCEHRNHGGRRRIAATWWGKTSQH